jgi:hypothetical protein
MRRGNDDGDARSVRQITYKLPESRFTATAVCDLAEEVG